MAAALAPEHATPPLPLVALLGCPSAADAVALYLRSGRRPPLTSVAAADAGAARRLFPARKAAPADPDAVAGLFKADWFAKHRTRRPAAVALLLERSAVDGDAAAWADAAASIDGVKTAAARRGAGLVLGVVGGGGAGEAPPPRLPDDRLAALARAAARPPTAVVCFDPHETDNAGVRRLGDALAAAAASHYKADADARRAAAAARGGGGSDAASARLHLKLAALAEFRGDWRAAATAYAAAHARLAARRHGGRGAGTDSPPLPSLTAQQADELAAVAELAFAKAATLLLHQGRPGDAAALFAAHVRAFGGPPPRAAPPGAAARAHAWTARQHALLADLLPVGGGEGGGAPPRPASGPPPPPGAPPPPSLSRLRFLADAARATVAARVAAAHAAAARASGDVPPPPAGVVPGAYLGQVVVAGPPPRRLTDTEYDRWLASSADASPGPALAVLAAARAAAVAGGVDSTPSREASRLADLAAGEKATAGDAAGAARDFGAAAAGFRADGWQGPLASVLLRARDLATASGDTAAHVTASLEAASLERGLDAARRTALAAAAVAAAADAAAAADGAAPTLDLDVSPAAPGLAATVALAGAARSAGGGPTFEGAFWSHLPAPVPLTRVEITVRDACGERVVAAAGALSLAPGAWTQVTAAWPPRTPGRTSVVSVRAWLGPGAALTWRAAAWAPAGDPGDDGAARVPPCVGRPPPPATRPPWPRAVGTGWEVDAPPAPGGARLAVAGPRCALAGAPTPLIVRVSPGDAALPEGCSIIITASDGGVVDGERVPVPATAANRWADARTAILWPAACTATVSVTLVTNGDSAAVAASTVAALEVVAPVVPARAAAAAPPGYASLHALPPPPPPADGRPPPLPTGEACVVTLALEAAAAVEIASVSFAPADGVAPSPAVAGPLPALLVPGDAHTVLVRVRRDEAGQGVGVGAVEVAWRRAAAEPPAWLGGGGAGGEPPSTDAASSPPPLATASIPLPPLSFAAPALAARADWPPSATAGAPSSLTLTLTAAPATPGARVGWTVADAPGWLIAGRRAGVVDVLPGRATVESVILVPHVAGVLALPAVTLTLEGGDGAVTATLDATAGGVVAVAPAVVVGAGDGGG